MHLGGWPLSLCGYLCLSLFTNWHAVSNVTTQASCGCGDPGLMMWFFAYQAHAIAHLQNPFFSSYVWAPFGANLIDTTSVIFIGWVVAPVTLLFGPVASFNVVMVASPLLSALAARWSYKTIFPSGNGYFVAGLFFGFSPFAFSHLAFGHFTMVLIVYVPITFGLLYRILVTQQRIIADSVLLGLASVGQFFISLEVLAETMMAILIASAIALALGLHKKISLRAPTKGLLVTATIAILGWAYPTWYFKFGPQHLSAIPWSYFKPHGQPFNFLWNTTPYIKKVSESAVFGYSGHLGPSGGYLGFAALSILVAGLTVALIRRSRTILWGILFAFVISLFMIGNSLTNGNKAPRSVIWLPWSLFAHIPFLKEALPSRLVIDFWWIIGFLIAGISTLIGHSEFVARLIRRRNKWKKTAAVGLSKYGYSIILLAVSSAWLGYLPLSTARVSTPPWFTTAISHVPTGSVVLTLPIPYGVSGSNPLVYQALTGFKVRLVGGDLIFSPTEPTLPLKHNQDVMSKIASGKIGSIPPKQFGNFLHAHDVQAIIMSHDGWDLFVRYLFFRTFHKLCSIFGTGSAAATICYVPPQN